MATPSYYKNENRLETSKKQQMILHYLDSAQIEIDSYTQHCIATAIKYIDRAGMKETDNWIADCYKAADYISQAITGNWIGMYPKTVEINEEENEKEKEDEQHFLH